MKISKSRAILIIVALITIIVSIPEIIHQNSGQSKSIGSVRNGQLKNGYILPYSGDNFSYFSPLSYYIMNNGYTHSTLYKTVLDAYKTCVKTCPNVHFKIMESCDKHGGKLLAHRTHQNGLGIDFMIPKVNKNGKQSKWLDWLGMWHYLLAFDDQGKNKIIKGIHLDFESMGKHIIALDDAAKANGLRIRKIILKTELKDELYASSSGAEIRRRDIYIVRRLSHIVNVVHDDHYHIDFEMIDPL